MDRFDEIIQFSNACGTGARNFCLNKCDVAHGDIQYNACLLSHVGRKDNREKCRAEVGAKRASCRNGCPKADQECIELKNNPPSGYTPEPPSPPESPPSDTSGSGDGTGTEARSDSGEVAKKVLIYTGVAVAGIAGLSLLIWGISSAVKKNK
jgi:hypothetical protein